MSKLAAALSLLEQHGLVRPAAGPAGTYEFSHSLVQAAAYASLVRQQRRRVHQVIAEVLEGLSPAAGEAAAPVLGEHFFEAGSLERARHYFAQAAAGAANLAAFPEAREYFTRAINVLPDVPAGLLRERGLVHDRLGLFEAALADLERARALAEQAGDVATEWQVQLDLALLWAGRDYARVGEHARAAHALALQLGDPVRLAHSLNRLGNWQLNTSEGSEAARLHTEALERFSELGDRRAMAETLDLRAMARFISGDMGGATADFRLANELYAALGDRLAVSLGRMLVSMGAGGYYNTGPLRPAAHAALDQTPSLEAAVADMQAAGWRSGEAYAQMALADYAGPHGDYARALPAARAALAVAEAIGHRQWMTGAHMSLGMLHFDVLAWPQAITHLGRALALARQLGSWHWTGVAAGELAIAHIEAQAVEPADKLLNDPSLTQFELLAPRTFGERVLVCAHAELALARGQSAAALDLAEALVRLTGEPASGQPEGVPILWLLLGRCLAAAGDLARAGAVLHAGLEAARLYGERTLEWRLLLALARLCEAAGQADEAATYLSRAEALVQTLAATLPDPTLAASLLSGWRSTIPLTFA